MTRRLSIVETEYNARIDAMLPKERVARSAAMFQWMRDMIGRQISRESSSPIPAEELKLRIGLRVYANEPAIVAMIEKRLDDVSGRRL